MGHAAPRPCRKPPPRVSESFDAQTWTDAARELYLNSPDMEVVEFEALLDDAIRGKRPKHSGLPAYPAFELEGVTR